MIEVALRVMAGTAANAAVPVNEILGLLAAFDCSVKVAVRLPAAVGVKLAPIVQVPPGATVTEAPTQVPVAVNSAEFVPLFAMPVIVNEPAPVFVNVTLAGVVVGLAIEIWVEPNVRVVPDSEITGAAPAAAAGFVMYAAKSAAFWLDILPARNPISLILPGAAKMALAITPFLMFLMLAFGFGPWQAAASAQLSPRMGVS